MIVVCRECGEEFIDSWEWIKKGKCKCPNCDGNIITVSRNDEAREDGGENDE